MTGALPAAQPRQPVWLRAVMALLAIPNVITGFWAIADPQHWYDTFPGWAPRLISALPPYNEHLATDAGAGLLASGVVMGLAALWPKREVVVTAAVAYLGFSLPHFVWHAVNPADPLSSAENGVNDFSLAAAVVGAGAVLIWQWHPSVRQAAAVVDPPSMKGATP